MDITLDARLTQIAFDKKHKDKAVFSFGVDALSTEDIIAAYRLLHSTGGLRFESIQGYVPQNRRQQIVDGQLTLDDAPKIEDDGSTAPVFCELCHDAIVDEQNGRLCPNCLTLWQMAKADVTREQGVLDGHLKGCVMAQANVSCEECQLLAASVDRASAALAKWAAYEPVPEPVEDPWAAEEAREALLTRVLDTLKSGGEVNQNELNEALAAAKSALAKATGGQVLEPLERRLCEQYETISDLTGTLRGDTLRDDEPEPQEDEQTNV